MEHDPTITRSPQPPAQHRAYRPGPLLRLLFAAPVWLYRCGLGRLLGRRFILLTHVGRRTGRPRRTVLEVMEYRSSGPEFVVMCAFGRKAGWLRNIDATANAEIMIGPDRFTVVHRVLDADEAVSVIAGYERRARFMAPVVRAVLRRLVGWRYDGSDAARHRLARQLPLIGFRAQQSAQHKP
jgi:deazaflavin-dependent oxidoreductase (nitroreductase family)